MRNEELIVSHMNYARKLARRRSKSQGVHIHAPDLESEALFGLVKAGVRFDSSMGHKFTSYVHCRIVGSLSDFLEKQNQRPFAELVDIYLVEPIAYQQAAEAETRRTVKAAVSSLPAQQHTILVMRFWLGLSHETISRAIKLNCNRVRKLEQQAMRQLRQFFSARNIKLNAFL